jgi:hypothetical protein
MQIVSFEFAIDRSTNHFAAERQQELAVEAICRRAGVKEGPLLDDCMLDVSVLNDNSAADVFVYAPTPVSVIKPLH